MVRDISRNLSELDAFIDILDEKYKNKLPEKLKQDIKDGRNKSYQPKYNKEISIKNQITNKETLAMIAFLDLHYWANADEKKVIYEALENNEKKLQRNLRRDGATFKSENEKSIKEHETSTLPIEYNKEKWYNKFCNFIKKIFAKK